MNVNPFPDIIFVLKMSASNELQTRFFMEANNMLGPYFLQYRLPKNIYRREKQMTSHDWQATGYFLCSKFLPF